MIVLHVARARTDSINIRGSLGKTWAALWITGATFLYFSGCNAHTPFTLFPFLRLSRLPLSFPSHYFPFTIFPYPPVIVLRFSLSPIRHVATFLPRSPTLIVFFSLSFSIFSILDPSPPTILFSGTDGDLSLSNCFPVANCYSLGRNGNYPDILFPSPVLAKLSFRIIH